jgi:uncharacterized membrane protein
MSTVTVRARDKDTLAEFLGWFSLGLGTAQLVAPRTLSRLIGASPDGAAPTLMRLMGAREIAHGVGILTRPRPTGWVWSRVGGDAVDLSLLGLLMAKSDHRARTAFALANVLSITTADTYESLHLTRKQGPVQAGRPIRKAVTIRKPREEVETAWAAQTDLRQKIEDQGAEVSFSHAPGGRGTELAVDFVYDPPAGDLGKAFEKVRGSDLATQLADDLRRFKQQLETGLIVRSESTPEGHLLANHLKQRAAQPLEEAVR